MDAFSWISSILNILTILSLVVGLWVAGKVIPTFMTRVSSENQDKIFDQPLAKTLLWIGVGSLYSLPLIDLISWVGNLVSVALVPQNGGGVSTFLGIISSRIYALFPLLLMLAIYGATGWAGIGFLSTSEQFNSTGRIFITLSIASLVYRGIHTLFSQVFSFQIPILNVQQDYGVTGFLFELVIGLVLLTLVLAGLNRLRTPWGGSGKTVK